VSLLVWNAGFCRLWRKGRRRDGCNWCRVLSFGCSLARLPLLLAQQVFHRLGVELDGYTRQSGRCIAGSIAPRIFC